MINNCNLSDLSGCLLSPTRHLKNPYEQKLLKNQLWVWNGTSLIDLKGFSFTMETHFQHFKVIKVISCPLWLQIVLWRLLLMMVDRCGHRTQIFLTLKLFQNISVNYLIFVKVNTQIKLHEQVHLISPGFLFHITADCTEEYTFLYRQVIPNMGSASVTFRPEFLRIRRRPIHMSVSNIWLQVWAMKSLCLAATASCRQVALLQFFSSYVSSFMAICSSCL